MENGFDSDDDAPEAISLSAGKSEALEIKQREKASIRAQASSKKEAQQKRREERESLRREQQELEEEKEEQRKQEILSKKRKSDKSQGKKKKKQAKEHPGLKVVVLNSDSSPTVDIPITKEEAANKESAQTFLNSHLINPSSQSWKRINSSVFLSQTRRLSPALQFASKKSRRR